MTEERDDRDRVEPPADWPEKPRPGEGAPAGAPVQNPGDPERTSPETGGEEAPEAPKPGSGAGPEGEVQQQVGEEGPSEAAGPGQGGVEPEGGNAYDVRPPDPRTRVSEKGKHEVGGEQEGLGKKSVPTGGEEPEGEESSAE